MADEYYEDVLVVCPYDESHKLKKSILQRHIASCRLNNLHIAKTTCPFNATHVVDPGELDYHLSTCPDRDSLGRHLIRDTNNPYKGRTDPYIDTEENWDLENPVTVVLRQQPPGAIIQPPDMAKPSERKRLYKSLHRMSSDPESNKTAIGTTEVLRQPKQRSQGKKVQVQQPVSTKPIETLGLGRGRASSRIAANFDVGNNNVAPQGATYSKVLQDMNSRLSRGQPIHQAAAPIFKNDDFPALGWGRGALHVPKH